VSVKNTDKKGVITRIENGKYSIGTSKVFYVPAELIAEKTAPKKKTINQASPDRQKLNAIYSLLSREYMQHNKTCIAGFEGCKGKANEIHHRYKRSGYYLIMTNYFAPVCRSCHRYATTHSKKAIETGLSVSRMADIPYSFTSYEKKLMARYGVNLP